MNEHRLRVTRRARYFTLGGDEHPTSAWLVVHGYAQLAASFLAGFEGVASPSRLVVAPEALNRFYLVTDDDGSHGDARVGATWMTRENREQEIADYIDLLDAVRLDSVPPELPLTVLGFSQGVATVTRWIIDGARPIRRAILWAGQLPHDADLTRLTGRVAEPVVLVSGESDVHSEWVRFQHQQARLREAGIAFRTLTFRGGHRLDRDVLADLATD